MIRDKFTKYEDIGYVCELNLNIKTGILMDTKVYSYCSKAIYDYGNSHEYYNEYTPNEKELTYIQTALKERNWFYSIEIETNEEEEGEESDIMENEMEELKVALINTNRLKYIGKKNFGQPAFKEK